MIDTILLQTHNTEIPENLSWFHSSMTSEGVWKQYSNPDEKFVRSYGYSPNITIKRERDDSGKDWQFKTCLLQFSPPKLLYGTNYYGVDESDYDAVVEKLVERSRFVGLPFSKTDIEQATLKRVDFCFNFTLPENFPYPAEFLKKMTSLDAGKALSRIKHREYIEEKEGFSFGLYNGSVGVGFYDKQAQLENQAKTTEDALVLVAMDLKEIPKKVLRMEVRWQNQKSVKQHLYTHLRGEKNQRRQLIDVFDNNLARTVLTDIFEQITENVDIQTLNVALIPIEDTIEHCKDAGLPLYDALALIGRAYVVQTLGANQFKQLQDTYYSRQTRANTQKRFERILNSSLLPISDLEQIFGFCKNQLKKFEIMKPYEQQSLRKQTKYNSFFFASNI